jgi:AcrR family transcriptional regulator
MKPRGRIEASNKRRREILEAALACFLEHGIAGTTTEQIRAKSGASIGSIYHHFGDKEALAAEIYLEALRDVQKGFLKELFKHRGARAGIRATVRYHLRWIRSKPAWARYLFQAREGDVIRGIEGKIAELNRQVGAEAARWVKPHVAKGVLTALPADVAVAVWLGPAQSFGRSWVAGRSKTSLDEAAEILADAAWKSLRRS